MSGLFGIISWRGKSLDPEMTGRMMEALAHRGTDARIEKRGEGFALGHCLLDTAGDGPKMGELLVDGDYLVVADCRLDNRDALAAALCIPPHLSDTAMLLAAYRSWGDNCPDRLLGDFAFAIWSRKNATLYCARDHFGVKPFYYYNDAGHFIFASEPGAIFASGLAQRTVMDERIADFLAGVTPPIDQTSYRGIFRLPSGHYAVVADGGIKRAPYWVLPRPEMRVRADAAAEFRQILTQAIEARLRGGEAGAMLSGGLDSSSIACIAARLLRARNAGPLRTFSLVFDETPEFNERPFIEAVLAQGGFAPTFIPSNRLAPFAALDTIIGEQQDLFLAPNLPSSRQIPHLASRQGLRILLDGHGGDEVAPVGGGRLHELARDQRWITLWQQLMTGYDEAENRKLPIFWRFFKNYGPLRQIFHLSRAARRRLGLGRAAPDASMRFMNPAFAARTNVAERFHKRSNRTAGTPITESLRHYEILTMPQQPYAFEILDRTAAAAGVEVRYPFWDKRLVEFCLSLDPADKLDGGWGRLILRRGMAGVLPTAVQWRREKFDFLPHVKTAIFRDHQALVAKTLADDADGLGEYVDLPAARALFSRLSGDVSQSTTYEIQIIIRIMVLAFWLKHQHDRTRTPVLA